MCVHLAQKITISFVKRSKLFTLALLSMLCCSATEAGASDELTGASCIEAASGNATCTANDVRISGLEVFGSSGTCVPGDFIDLTLIATIESGPDRYDIGIWLNETGGSALDDLTGTCFRTILTPLAGDIPCNHAGGVGPYLNADGDTCGDVPSLTGTCSVVQVPCSEGGGTCTISKRTFDITLKCNDSDNDGQADVSTCTSWDNNDNTSCTGAENAVPGTGSKCSCGVIPIGDLFIDPCAGVDCSGSNTACGVASCDPNGAPGNCTILTPLPNTTLCRAGVGECGADEFCDGTTTTCPADGFQPEGTECGDGSGTICDNPDTCDGLGACQDNFAVGTTQCRADQGDCDVPEFCDGAGSCPADGFETSGTSCGSGSDTVCDNPDTCDGSGSCQSNNEPGSTLCGVDAGECDVPEFCDGTGSCPGNAFEPAGTSCGSVSDTVCDNPDTCNGVGSCQSNNESAATECRADVGECDVAERCDGAGACPGDTFEPSGTACGSDADTDCDNPDACDGTGSCLVNNEPITTECRADAGECDVPETCDGAGSCPADAFEAADTPCGSSADTSCDNPDKCDAVGSCQSNNEPNTTVCREDAGDCDVQELCDGEGACPDDGFEPGGTACGNPGDSACDDPDLCDAAGQCLPNLASTDTVCRPDAGDCDVPELCDGAGNCPATDSLEPDGTLCTEGDDDACTTAQCAAGLCDQLASVVTCEDPICQACNTDTGICVPREDPPQQCIAEEICRTPGFFGTHAGVTKKDSQNITGALLTAAGGSIQVCGITLNSVDVNSPSSALEALCVSVEGSASAQLVRQLTAFALNCVVSGSPADCSGVSPEFAALFADCNLACTGDPGATRTIAQCVSEVDCFNNGGAFVDGTCYRGVCSDNGAFCNAGDLSECLVPECDPLDLTCVAATCNAIPGNCHDRELCLDAETPYLCFEPTGPAGSSSACNKAIKNSCLVTDGSSCGSARSGGSGARKRKSLRLRRARR